MTRTYARPGHLHVKPATVRVDGAHGCACHQTRQRMGGPQQAAPWYQRQRMGGPQQAAPWYQRQRMGGPQAMDGTLGLDPASAAALITSIETARGPLKGIISGIRGFFGGYSNDGPKGLQPELEAIVVAHERGQLSGFPARVRLYLSARLRSSHTARARLQGEVKALGFDRVSGDFGNRPYWDLQGPMSGVRRIVPRYHESDGDAVGGLNGVLRLHAAPEMLEQIQQFAQQAASHIPGTVIIDEPPTTGAPPPAIIPELPGTGSAPPVQQAGLLSNPVALLVLAGAGFAFYKQRRAA